MTLAVLILLLVLAAIASERLDRRRRMALALLRH
jgi:hypothetical protein